MLTCWGAQVSLRWECAASRTGGQAAMVPVAGRGPLWRAVWPRERPCRLDPGDRLVNLQARPQPPRLLRNHTRCTLHLKDLGVLGIWPNHTRLYLSPEPDCLVHLQARPQHLRSETPPAVHCI